MRLPPENPFVSRRPDPRRRISSAQTVDPALRQKARAAFSRGVDIRAPLLFPMTLFSRRVTLSSPIGETFNLVDRRNGRKNGKKATQQKKKQRSVRSNYPATRQARRPHTKRGKRENGKERAKSQSARFHRGEVYDSRAAIHKGASSATRTTDVPLSLPFSALVRVETIPPSKFGDDRTPGRQQRTAVLHFAHARDFRRPRCERSVGRFSFRRTVRWPGMVSLRSNDIRKGRSPLERADRRPSAPGTGRNQTVRSAMEEDTAFTRKNAVCPGLEK